MIEGYSAEWGAIDPMPPVLNYLMSLPGWKASHISGSKYIMVPPPEGRDEDWFVLTRDRGAMHERLIADGFKAEGSSVQYNPYAGEFRSYRKEGSPFNFIITEHEWFYQAALLARDVARRYQVKERDKRVAIFVAIRNAARPEAFRDDSEVTNERYGEPVGY